MDTIIAIAKNQQAKDLQHKLFTKSFDKHKDDKFKKVAIIKYPSPHSTGRQGLMLGELSTSFRSPQHGSKRFYFGNYSTNQAFNCKRIYTASTYCETISILQVLSPYCNVRHAEIWLFNFIIH